MTRRCSHEWKAVCIAASKPSLKSQYSTVRAWRKPMSGRVKCNIDASFSSNSDRVGIALGLLSALNRAHELQLGPVEFELDSKRVVDSFHSL
ncbi:receptor-like kinase CR4, partial [Trifolium medium]|nr:receptor-like kinase CR4 [Trifolium medium]